MRVLIGSLLALWLAAAVPAAAADLLDGVDISGSLKSLSVYSADASPFTAETVFSLNGLRLDLNPRLSDVVSAEVSFAQQLLWTSRPELVSLSGNQVNRVADLETVWRQGEHFSGLTQIDRLNIRGETENLFWALGRQAIGFGRITLFSPLDVIAPFPPDALDVDIRPGVDALRVNYYFGKAGQVGGAVVFGDDKEHNSYLLTAGENVYNIDLLLLVGSLRGRNMVGFGIAGELGKLGVKLEGSWYRGTEVGRLGGDPCSRFAIAAVEGWYRFDNGLVLLAEYLYNGYGAEEPADYLTVATSAPLDEGLGFLLGRHYLLLGPSYQLHPLVTLNGLVIYNIEDCSALVRPQLAISLGDNTQLDLFWGVTTGRGATRDSLTQLPVMQSEFGSAGDSGGVLLRWYF
ncbi:MAG: hypothetical protein C0622_14435 [Desulfuromonas sp.]|nr:MAG: hypothetical protein C0622_14435 [Desulfuromonas sp.]